MPGLWAEARRAWQAGSMARRASALCRPVYGARRGPTAQARRARFGPAGGGFDPGGPARLCTAVRTLEAGGQF